MPEITVTDRDGGVHRVNAREGVSLMETLATLGIRYQPTLEAAAMRAGHMNKRFRSRGGRRERVVADFLIGAHALLQCDGLITRDDAFFRDYFKGLKLIVPKAT